MRPLGKYMYVNDPTESGSGKTKVWVIDDADGDMLGDVAWFGRWRCYAFHPEPGTVFNADCMRDLAGFCDQETRIQRRKK